MLQSPTFGVGAQPALLSRELLDHPRRLIDIHELCRLLGKQKTYIYGALADPASDLPRPVKVGRSTRWLLGEVLAYVDGLIARRDAAKAVT